MCRVCYSVLCSLTVALVLFAVGCNGTGSEPSDEGLFATGGGTAAGKSTATPVDDSQGFGTITGTVTFDGDPPVMAEMPGMRQHADAKECLKGTQSERDEQTWMVDSGTKAVRNVVVWVTPPKGQYFKKPADDKKTWKDEVTVDQPHCAFIPHVVVLFPQYFDGEKRAATGQKMTVLNSAKVAHNIRVGGSSQFNPSSGGTVSPGLRYEFTRIRVDKQEVSMNCDIHKWMNGFAMTFDHPYAAVTDAEGKFKIENVPAGSELTFMGWHEALKKFTPEVSGGTKIKLEKDKPVDLSFKIRAK